MRHGSLFSGIGGFDLAAEWMGWENVFHCEWNEFGKRVLNYYWPKSISYDDITKTDFTIHRGDIDILTGGFPCQAWSIAGKQKGFDDSRDMWSEMFRAIREIKPRWVVAENVYQFIRFSGGVAYKRTKSNLEAEGYEVASFILPATSIGAIHKRERIFIVAYSKCNRFQGELQQDSRKTTRSFETLSPFPLCKNPGELSEPYCLATNDGLPIELSGIAFSKWRSESIKAIGNSVVPQLVYQIFKAINEFDK